MRQELERAAADARRDIAAAADTTALENIRVAYLGKKGTVTGILRSMGSLSPEERPVIGALANQVRNELEDLLGQRAAELSREMLKQRLVSEAVDVTLPGTRRPVGGLHPLTQVMNEIIEIFVGMGFEVADGPEIELDRYNFEALNIPKDHPAREMHDSFYLSPEVLLRTHTSPVQARVMESRVPKPIRIIAPGRCYRRDALDATHSPAFMQVEGLVVDEGITFANLKGTLDRFVKELYGEDRRTRFVPSYFPFTEPSAETYISCFCGGKGCRICKHTGWIELGGAGLVNPNVLRYAGYDPERFSGFAFGWGIERIAMLKYGIDDIRLFYENDLRFLEQF